MQSRPTLLVIDDNADDAARLRERLDALDEFDLDLTVEADPASALERIANQPPTIVMLDDRLRTGGGGELVKAIRDAGFRGPVIALAGQADVYRAAEITRAGVDHYLLKQDLPGPRLLAVLRGAVDHARISGPERPAPAEQAERQDTLEKLARLTPRESQVLDEIVLGLTNQQIADKMHRSVETIKVHRSHIMSKMKAQTTADLVRRVVTARLG